MSDRHPGRRGGHSDTAGRARSGVVNAAGLVQGIALVTFPAASGIFTASTGHAL